ncbi:hypothetical protein HOLleu_17485 [Holothuria leucospilota]|uniref:Uncharacterized protein n=1 Tax=Holothuria leucospilota TaxID=206669 RepID=A0A9Q1H940_HOLLE|nr:hypothetical protein HOLleu_17485 [Holothuria leucospilota]
MGKIPSEERFNNGSYLKAFFLVLVLAQVTWPIRSVRAARRCSDACYRSTERYCKVFYGGRVALCVKCEVPCSSRRLEDQRVCAEFCQDSEYYASTETPLEQQIPADSIHETSTTSPISDVPSTNTFYTSVQLTTKLLTSLGTQNMTEAVFENSSITTNTSSDVRNRHGRNKHVEVFSIFLLSGAIVGVSSSVICLFSICAKCMEVKFSTFKVRPVQNNETVYAFTPLSQGNAGNGHQDQSMAKQGAVTRYPLQVIYQTAWTQGQTVISQASDCNSAGQDGHNSRVVPRPVMNKGSAKSVEGRNKPFTSTHTGRQYSFQVLFIAASD